MTGASRSTASVTVIITSYNRESYLESSIRSVLAQTYRDFEILIVDDASTDGSLAVARSFAKQDSRIRVKVNPRNLGDYPNRNHAASLVRTPLLKFHDSDDLMYPHCLQVMIKALHTHREADFALTTNMAWDGGPCPMLVTPEQAYQREFLGLGMFNGGPANAIFRTSFFFAQGGFPLAGVGSDYYFWLQACRTAQVVLVPADLFWYRTHSGQELTSAKAAREYAETFGATWDALRHPTCPLQGQDLIQARRNQVFSLLRVTLRDVRTGHYRLAAYRLRRSGITWHDWLTYLRRPRRNRWAGSPMQGGGTPPEPAWLRPREKDPTDAIG